jgi:hypothetical protein
MKKQPQESNWTTGENSPNLATLLKTGKDPKWGYSL